MKDFRLSFFLDPKFYNVAKISTSVTSQQILIQPLPMHQALILTLWLKDNQQGPDWRGSRLSGTDE